MEVQSDIIEYGAKKMISAGKWAVKKHKNLAHIFL